MQQLSFGNIVQSAMAIGSRNAASLVGAIILWLVTFWIPYLNVGTTIGLIGIVAKMGRGSAISPTEIFDPAYRKQMGEFFLVMIFVTMGVYIGVAFLVIPGIVISLAWLLAPLLVLDKGVNPIESLKQSNDLMDGHKAAVFFAQFAVNLGGMIVVGIIMAIAGAINVGALTGLAMLVCLAIYVIMITANLGVTAHVYSVLVEADAPAPAAPAAE